LKRATIIRAAAIAGATLAGTALLNIAAARRTERCRPASGRFIDIGDTRLNYTDEGNGPPIVLLHGNGPTSVDWKSSGLIGALAATNRVIAFDRPGFGYSNRTRGRVWTAAAQATLLHDALVRLNAGPALVVGHSWGTLVALQFALQYPGECARLLVISGYYFPTFRPDAALFSVPALPIVGDALCYTIAPLLARLLARPISARVFSPAPVDEAFAAQLPMAMRPSQIRAIAEDIALMIPCVAAIEHRYKDVHVPVVVVAGAADKVVHQAQARRLAGQIPESQLLVIPGAGHMLHYTANDTIVRIITGSKAAPAPQPRSHDVVDNAVESEMYNG
jgi:pimeloyl-ACP methyl ester carboxylesterase